MDRSYTDELEKLDAELQKNPKTKDKFILIGTKRHSNQHEDLPLDRELEQLKLKKALEPCRILTNSASNKFIQQKRQGKWRIY
jgi:hypothetical protein